MSSSSVPAPSPPPAPPGQGWLIWTALVLALVASAGSVWLSVGMGLQACPLCFYQRAFAMAVLAVLATGLTAGLGRIVPISLLAVPISAAGLVVALMHVRLELNGTL